MQLNRRVLISLFRIFKIPINFINTLGFSNKHTLRPIPNHVWLGQFTKNHTYLNEADSFCPVTIDERVYFFSDFSSRFIYNLTEVVGQLV